MEKTTDTNAPVLPTHGGLYEFDPDTKTMRTLEGGEQNAAAPADAQNTTATTGEQE